MLNGFDVVTEAASEVLFLTSFHSSSLNEMITSSLTLPRKNLYSQIHDSFRCTRSYTKTVI
jgi:hypothetical protein